MSYPFSASFIAAFITVLVAIAFYTLVEPKFMGYFQLRKGPNKVSLIGLPQPFADAIKLFTKEQNKPTLINKNLFVVAPVTGLILALLLWAIFPHNHTSIFISFGILYFLCVSRINVYATFISGWCSNSKYALLGALRGVAQTISYEVSIALIILRALAIIQSIDISLISSYSTSWIILCIIPLIVIWFITNLAETNRTPFDLAEGESELVSGFNTEYRARIFALIFIAEYTNILLIRLLTVILFSGGLPSDLISDYFLIIKTLIVAILFIWIRCTLPRIRYDKLIYLTWKVFLPIRLTALVLIFPILTLLSWYCAGRTDNSDDVN